MKNSFSNITVEEVLKALDTTKKGLTSAKVEALQKEYGLNALPKARKKTIPEILFKEIKEPIVLILLITIIISFFTQEYVDAIAIIFIVLIDIIIGLIQELKACKNAESLQNLLKVKCLVKRDGREILIDATELVLGDIVVLSSGNKISADMRLISTDNLNVDESMLTGESLPILKTDQIEEKHNDLSLTNMVYAGTSVLKGRALGVVVATGLNTELGKIASVVDGVKESPSPLEIRMNKFTKQISIIIVLIALFLAFVLIVKGTPIADIFLVVVALAVSAMPEGLPLAKTMALTIGSNRMLKKRANSENYCFT